MHTNMLSTADLHLHTIYSDGHCTPAELVNHVLTKTDLRVIAVTDHDAIAGAYEAQRCATGSSLEVIIGEEISTSEGHLLAYFIHELIPPACLPATPLPPSMIKVGWPWLPTPMIGWCARWDTIA